MSCKRVCIFLIVSLFISEIRAQCDSNAVRITGGPNQFEGRVQLCVSNEWRQVCAMSWNKDDAGVVCHQLGYGRTAQSVLGNIYDGQEDLSRSAVTDVRCNGMEENLGGCSLTTLNTFNMCDDYDGPAGVMCQDPLCVNDSTSVRLSQGEVVEVCAAISGYRTGVCSENWDNTDASVVCRQLNLGQNGVADSTDSSVYRFRFAFDNVSCDGTEERLSDCTHGLITSTNPREACSTSSFARVRCEGASTTDSSPVTDTTVAQTTSPPVDTTIEVTITTDSATSTKGGDQDTTMEAKLNPTTGIITSPPQATTDAGSAQLSESDGLLAIVLGAVGGVIALLLLGIIVLLVLIVLGRKRRKYSVQYLDNNSPNGPVVMAGSQVKSIEDSQLVNSYSSQKGDPERLLLNPLYLHNQQQMANTNPLPYTSVVTPPSTAGEYAQIHEYATLDNFQSTLSPWTIHQQPQEYSTPVTPSPVTPSPVNRDVIPHNISPVEAANAYREAALENRNYQVGEDGIVTDLEGYAAIAPMAHSYDCPQVNGAAVSGEEPTSTLPIPQPYETPFESSYEDASSTTISRASTPLSAKRESPERGEHKPASNTMSLERGGRINPYSSPSPRPDASDEPGSHNYATLESPN